MTKKKRTSKNLKITTRVTLSTILAIAIPLVIVITFSSIFLNTMASYFNLSAVTTDSYSMLNQIQWSQTISEISNELVTSDDDTAKIKKLEKFLSPLEQLGCMIYIDCNGEPFYSTTDVESIKTHATSIMPIDTEKNVNHFSEDGIVIVTHAENDDSRYLVIIVNDNYIVNDISDRYTAQDFSSLMLGKTGLILSLVALVFIISILLMSIITSKTISKPIKELADGANEIANGNLNFVIDYESTNEIGSTVSAFNDMTSTLRSYIDERQQVEDSRKEMIAGVAHDLRTPLTSIKGYVEGLRDGIASTPEMQEQYLQTISSSTADMEALLDELQSYSHLERGIIELNCEPIDFNSFLEDCASELKMSLAKDNVIFDYVNQFADERIMVSLDIDRFSRVITNIISNSIKYSKKDAQPKIELSLQNYEKSVIISISDNGIGIDSADIPRIFDIFYRADKARTRVHDGSGIGLSVCKQIVQLHGGEIWATSTLGAGTTITISLQKMTEDTNE